MMLNKLFILLIGIAFVGCNSSNEKIIGRWKIVKNIQNGEEYYYPEPMRRVVREVEFFKNGEYIHLHNGELVGVGIYKYEIKGDSIFRRNESKDPKKGEEPIIFDGTRIKWINDTLFLEVDSGWVYLISNNK